MLIDNRMLDYPWAERNLRMLDMREVLIKAIVLKIYVTCIFK